MGAEYFSSPETFRRWLSANHGKATEVLVGFYKKHTGKPSLTWVESVDQALCFGWIDGVRKRVDDDRYTLRFTPRKKNSTWSQVNVERVPELERLGLMKPAGMKAFEARTEAKTGTYSYENRPQDLPPEYGESFKAERRAWEFFGAQAPSYRRAATWWVLSAKKEETRRKRLATLIQDSKNGRRLPHLTPPSKK